MLAPGAVIGGKYRVERALARGGMGSVWVARHVQLGSEVALKFLDAKFAESAGHRARFEREARAAANLKSPHVVQVTDYGFEGAAPYLVMELLEGEDLGQRLARVGRLSLADTTRILNQVAKALRKAHEAGIVHRDLKPANLFLARVDDDEVVKVLDFGIAKEAGAALGDATKTGEVMGSPHYMSPEQVRAEKDLDFRTDLWSLGIILYRALVGELPFPGDQLGPVLAKILTEVVPVPSRLAPDLPASIDAFMARALMRDKAQRFQSVMEMAAAFQAAASGRFGSQPVPIGSGSVAVAATGAAPGQWAPQGSYQGAYPRASGASGAPGSFGAAGASGAPEPQTAVLGAGSAPENVGAGFGDVQAPGRVSGSGPYGVVAQSGPIAQAGAMANVSATTAGLATTGAPARPGGGGVGLAIAIGAVTVLVVAGAITFFIVRSPSAGDASTAAGATATSVSAEVAPTASTVMVAPSGAVSVAATASVGSSAPSTSSGSSTSSVASTSTLPTPKPTVSVAAPTSPTTTSPTKPSSTTTSPTKPSSTATSPTKPSSTATATKPKEKWF